MECLYKSSTLRSDKNLWVAFLPVLRNTFSSEYHIKAPERRMSVASSSPQKDEDVSSTHRDDGDVVGGDPEALPPLTTHQEGEEYFGAGYCISQIKPTAIINWFRVWVEFPTTQEVVYFDGNPFTSYDLLERVVETNFEVVDLWFIIQHFLYLDNEGSHRSKEGAVPSKKNNSIIFKKRNLEITVQYCSIRILELDPSPENWKSLLTNMDSDEVVFINGREYSTTDVVDLSELGVGMKCSIHRNIELGSESGGGGAGYNFYDQLQNRCWDCAYLNNVSDDDDGVEAIEFWFSLIRHVYYLVNSSSSSLTNTTSMETIVLNGTSCTLLQCLEIGLKHLPKHTEAWEIIIKTMHQTNTTQVVIDGVVFTRAQCILYYSSISGCRTPIGWIPTAEVMEDDDILITTASAAGRGGSEGDATTNTTMSFSKKDCYMHGICDSNPQGTAADFAKAWRGLANCCGVEGDGAGVIVIAPRGEQFTSDECNRLADTFESKVNFKYGHGYVTNCDRLNEKQQQSVFTPIDCATSNNIPSHHEEANLLLNLPTSNYPPTSSPPLSLDTKEEDSTKEDVTQILEDSTTQQTSTTQADICSIRSTLTTTASLSTLHQDNFTQQQSVPSLTLVYDDGTDFTKNESPINSDDVDSITPVVAVTDDVPTDGSAMENGNDVPFQSIDNTGSSNNDDADSPLSTTLSINNNNNSSSTSSKTTPPTSYTFTIAVSQGALVKGVWRALRLVEVVLIVAAHCM